jgi:hypothetical protein
MYATVCSKSVGCKIIRTLPFQFLVATVTDAVSRDLLSLNFDLSRSARALTLARYQGVLLLQFFLNAPALCGFKLALDDTMQHGSHSKQSATERIWRAGAE